MDPPGDTGLARCDDGITLILIAESTKHVIKLEIHLGNPGQNRRERVVYYARHEKLADNHRAMIKLAASPIWLRFFESMV